MMQALFRSHPVNAEFVTQLVVLAEAAGRATMQVRQRGFSVKDKADRSPVTEADVRAHGILVEGLSKLTPEIPVISEEGALPGLEQRRSWRRWYLVDPLDGTREFSTGGTDFTVNIALVERGRSKLGVVHVPVTGETFVGAKDQQVAYLRLVGGEQRTLCGRVWDSAQKLRVVASKSHRTAALEAYLGKLADKFGQIDAVAYGSSLKFCALADGRAHLYPRLGPTSQWDTAAGQAVLEAAGGAVWSADGGRLCYTPRESFLNPDFLASADDAMSASELYGSSANRT